ncbi:MAG: TolC family protein [Desulfarculaceae bacterium]|nr:TolC family protein [Desulfarculaceae bacterium]MCF8071141.1 TolC family protein [Desulfarculaceae bacterium]MCF8101256.1 TolC family protein [Desulfarculaceae bacterium]MCF8115195.1 TolC family protein [Desulfarculaceae bacterium]
MPIFRTIIALLMIAGMAAPVLPARAGEAQGEPPGVTLPLRDALVRGIEKNLELKMAEVDIPVSQEQRTVEDAQFDPVLDASVYTSQDHLPSASALAGGDHEDLGSTGGTVGVSKRFQTGLRSRVGVESLGADSNSAIVGLNPSYRTYLTLDLTQPLLRGAGPEVNTANLRIAQNRVSQSRYYYLDRAQGIAQRVENTYYLLSLAHQVLKHRIESRNLAQGLLDGNRRKFKAGVVPVTEVQEAKTAVASRDEQIVYARQQMETVSNQLKNLLEIRPGDPLYNVTIIPQPLSDAHVVYPKFGQALALALKHRPDLINQRLELKTLDIRLVYFDNQQLPRLDAQGSLAANGLSGTEREYAFDGSRVNSPFAGDYGDSWSSMAGGDGYSWYIGLDMEYPIGNRAAKARYSQAAWEKKRGIYRLKRLEGTAETELKNALVTLNRSWERVQVAERFVRLAETTLKQENRRLDEGLSDSFRILDFQNSVIAARIRKAAAVADFNSGLADLHRAIGDNLSRYNIMPAMGPKETANAR